MWVTKEHKSIIINALNWIVKKGKRKVWWQGARRQAQHWSNISKATPFPHRVIASIGCWLAIATRAFLKLSFVGIARPIQAHHRKELCIIPKATFRISFPVKSHVHQPWMKWNDGRGTPHVNRGGKNIHSALSLLCKLYNSLEFSLIKQPNDVAQPFNTWRWWWREFINCLINWNGLYYWQTRMHPIIVDNIV